MDKTLKKYLVFGMLVVISAGVVSHFVYDWSGQNFLVGFLFPINESTWEHMKLLFFPMLVYAFAAGRYLEKDYPCIYDGLAKGILAGTFAIPVLFYTYKGILGFHVDWLNIVIYIISVVFGFWVVYRQVKECDKVQKGYLWWIAVFALLMAFLLFTYYPPNLALFQEIGVSNRG